MDLSVEIYLSSAFRELDAFAIPRIGTFRKLRKGAYIHENKSLVFPPEIEIEFDPVPETDLLLTYYLRDHIHMDAPEAVEIVERISETILSFLRKNGYFEIPNIGVLQKNQDESLTFFTLSSEENVLAGDYFGLKPVRFTQHNQLVLHQSENPTYMKNDRQPEKESFFGSVGWKTFLLIALIFTMGFLIVNQGPFIKHRSSLDNGILAIKPLEPPRIFPGEFFTENQPEILGDTDQQNAEANEGETDLPASTSVEPVIVDEPLASNTTPDDETESIPEDQLFSDNSNARLAQEGTSRGMTRGAESTDSYNQVKHLSVLDTSTENENSNGITRSNTSSVTYHLIAGSFSTLTSAKKFMAELDKNDTEAIILFPPEGSSQTYRISIYRNSQKKRVEEFAAKLEKLGKKSGWIYEEK